MPEPLGQALEEADIVFVGTVTDITNRASTRVFNESVSALRPASARPPDGERGRGAYVVAAMLFLIVGMGIGGVIVAIGRRRALP